VGSEPGNLAWRGNPTWGLPPVLEYMLEFDHLMPRVMAVDCLLDECGARSYEALSGMSRILLAEIHAQERAPHALQSLVINQICELEKLISAKLISAT
jgi:hypothetical protein